MPGFGRLRCNPVRSLLNHGKGALDLLDQPGEVAFQDGLLRVDDHVNWGMQLSQTRSNRFAQPPPDPVPLHGVPQSPANGKTYAWSGRISSSQVEHRQVA